MDYFNEPNQRRPRYFPFILICLLCAILGSGLSIAMLKVFDLQAPTVISPVKVDQPTTPTLVSSSNQDSSFQVVSIAKNVGPAVVGIANFQSFNSYRGGSGANLQEVGSGSGIVVDAAKGYIVTNNHVVDGAAKLVVSLADGRRVDGKLVGADPRTDLAVVQINDTAGLIAAPIGDSKSLQVGEPVVAIGNPGGEQFARSVTQGVISALDRVLQLSGESSFNLIQTDAAINPGNSGGALVNWQGKVVGINSAKNQEQGFEGMGFAIPISDAWPVITQLIQNGRASHAGILVSIDNRFNADYAKAQGLPAGALVGDVSATGPAAKAGIQAGDIITSINGHGITNYYGLVHELFKYKAGDTVKVSVSRNGKQIDTQVTLVELPSNQ